ncbi:MAG: GDP-fucose synthetase [Betaproteobacteria bacterium RIFCSPLOWO2_12_FULL_66_14]|nr:MAG: GDP-fucose synthetase [Betaproteobacteria bacterium RIFCSPLOWO2_12_FULL_66_14]
MHKSDRIYVAGHRGLAGSALMRALKTAGYTDLLTRTRSELDLQDQAAVTRFFESERPDHVFLAAGKVGGIVANNTYPADFIYQNLAIESHVVHSAWRCGVKRLLLLGSSCIYPRDCPQPIKEEYLLTGPLEPTNRAYAIAKIAGVEMCRSYNRQHGTRFLSVMPTNLFGPGDNYDLETSHVLPALIRKAHEAKARSEEKFTVWGTGAPRREFLYSDDMADACVFLMSLGEEQFAPLVAPGQLSLLNVGAGRDMSIRELAEVVAEVIGFHGRIEFDTGKPDGTPQKKLDVSRLSVLGWRPRIGLRQGIALAYKDFLRGGVPGDSERADR